MVRPALCAGTSRDAAVLASAGSAMSTANPGREGHQAEKNKQCDGAGLAKKRVLLQGSGLCWLAEIAAPLLSVHFNSFGMSFTSIAFRLRA